MHQGPQLTNSDNYTALKLIYTAAYSKEKKTEIEMHATQACRTKKKSTSHANIELSLLAIQQQPT